MHKAAHRARCKNGSEEGGAPQSGQTGSHCARTRFENEMEVVQPFKTGPSTSRI
jgi:hypothetical protein